MYVSVSGNTSSESHTFLNSDNVFPFKPIALSMCWSKALLGKGKSGSQYQDLSYYLSRDFNPESHDITITFPLRHKLHWAYRHIRVNLDKVWWMKNLLTQWETEEKNLRTNLMKNLLTQWETKEKNQKTSGNVSLIDREHNGNILLLDSKHSGNVLLIDRNLQNWKMILNVHLSQSSQNWKMMLNMHLF